MPLAQQPPAPPRRDPAEHREHPVVHRRLDPAPQEECQVRLPAEQAPSLSSKERCSELHRLRWAEHRCPAQVSRLVARPAATAHLLLLSRYLRHKLHRLPNILPLA
jgi:hypothetical protein